MEDTTQVSQAQAPVQSEGVSAVTPVVEGRYKVSRQGMGGRKAKYDLTLLTELLELQKAGTSLLGECKKRGLPYVSINSAMHRLGLK
jgi:hypothetical protein